MTEAFQFITEFWERGWYHAKPPLEHMQDDWDQVTQSAHSPPEVWNDLAPADVMPHVPKLNASFAGLDGWSGPELNSFSVSMTHALTDFYVFMESAACCPKKCVQIRQTHIPKPKGFCSSDQAFDVACLLPISVASIFWRLWASARLKHTCTDYRIIDWVNAWCPNDMHAGKRIRGTYIALHDIYLMLLKTATTLVALIAALPSTGRSLLWLIHAFKRQGMPMNIAAVLDSMWCPEERFLQLLGKIHSNPKHVDSSLLQGDPFSMIALHACLLAPLQDTQSKHPGIRQVLYVDDRTSASPSLDELMKDNMVNCAWPCRKQQTCNFYQLFQYTAAGQRAISEAGYSVFASFASSFTDRLDRCSISDGIYVTKGGILQRLLPSEPCHFVKGVFFCWASRFVRANILYKMTSGPVIL